MDLNTIQVSLTFKVEELKAVVEYIVAQYKDTCARKSVSGTHVDFAYFINGKLWL